MKTAFRASFSRDLRKIQDPSLYRRIRDAIVEIEEASSLEEIRHLKKVTGASGFFRIRIGEYRIGIAVSGDEVELVRCLHRRDIYRYFP